MNAATWEALRTLLVARYDEFHKRLRRRLGSGDLAHETLHDTFVQLNRSTDVATIDRPDAYLYRIALNVAAMRRRSEARLASALEIEEAIDQVDEAAHPDRVVAGRFDVEALKQAIAELPPRRRAIFLAARVEEKSVRSIAAAYGVSTRLVELEIRKALDHCAAKLDRPATPRFRAARRQASTVLKHDSGDDDGI